MVDITWLGHSTFQLRLPEGETVVLDPWVEQNPSFPKGFRFDRIDTMLVSHGHSDHIGDAVRLAKEHRPSSVVAIFEVAMWLGSKGVENVAGMNKGGSQKAGSLTVTMTHAMHSSSIQDGDRVVYGGEPAGFILHLPDGRRAYFAGDTTVFGDMALIRELYSPEIAFLPIGDLYTMGPKEAAVACRLLQPKVVIPMHYNSLPVLTGTPGELASLIRQTVPGAEVRTLTAGRAEQV